MDQERIQICRGFTVQQWRALRPRLDANDDHAWRLAVDVLRRRIGERYTSIIDVLLRADSGASADVEVQPGAPADGSTLPSVSAIVPGFSIVALCCLLIETIHSFRAGASSHTEAQFKLYLQRPSFAAGAFMSEPIAKSFYKGVRCGVLHEAETRRWLLWRAEPTKGVVEDLGDGRYGLNRTAFFYAVTADFESLCTAIAGGDSSLRKKFRIQMDDMLRQC